MRARAALVAAALLLAAGCSSTEPAATATGAPIVDEPATEIMLDSIAALDAAESFHYSTAGVDVRVVGDDLRAAVGDVEVIRVGGDTFIGAPRDYWSTNLPIDVQDALLPRLDGKYAKAAPHDTSFDPLVPSVFGLVTLISGVTKGEQTTIDGTPAIVITGSGRQLFVATEGEPYPLRLVDGDAVWDFDGFDAGAPIVRPTDDRVFDLADLGGCSSRTRFACVPPEGTEF